MENNILTMVAGNLPIIIIAALTLNLLFLIWLLLDRLSRRKTRELVISLRASENSIAEINKLIAEEMKPVILETNQKIKQLSEEIIKSYRSQADDLVQKLNSKGEETLKQFSEQNKKIQNATEGFLQKINSEGENTLSQFSEHSKELKKKIEELLQASEKELLGLQRAVIDSQQKLQRTGEEKLAEEIAKINQEHEEIKAFLLKEAEKEIKRAGEETFEKLSPAYEQAVKEIGNRITATNNEINNYKQNRLKEIDEKIYQQLGEIAKETLGKTIDLAAHEKLVQEAIEKAKKEIF
jgi:F0F1-type ATP synthase membrane subunit b/b'